MLKKQNKYYIFIPIIIALSFVGGLLLGSKLDALNQVNIGDKTKGKLKLNQLIDFLGRKEINGYRRRLSNNSESSYRSS